ncbi:MAG: insulinase family protein, partial [Lachnospiraceae bacterium]|nr:insulinase family protein [Lachnospiraceae bacterium]
TDPEEPLTLNGVVYNEMKGVFSSPDEMLEREIMNSMFPDTQYGVDSGGEPEVIPDLTYEAYLDFHRKYFHPSNCYIYLYGNMDAADTLDFIDREYLSRFEAAEVDSALREQKPFGGERVTKKFYPVAAGDDIKKKTYLSMSFAAGDPLNSCEMVAMQVLDYALLGAPGAPVRKALLDAGIGLDVYGGFSDGILQPYFSITAKDADEEDADRFRRVIRETLEKQVSEGIDRKSVKAALSTLEFSYREADFGNYPKGLFYCMDVMETWLYDDDEPFATLKLLDVFREMEKLAETDYFEKMISEKFLRSDHSVLVILSPKPGLAEEMEMKTEEKLAAIKAGMSAEEIKELVSETEALLAWQDSEDTPEAISTLPVLKRSDIRREVTARSNIEETITVKGDSGNEIKVPAVLHEKETNGIGYLQIMFGTKAVPDEMIPYLGLLKECLTYVSTAWHDYADLTNEIGVRSGGITFTSSVLDPVNAPDSYLSYFEVRMKALISKYEDGTELIREILYTSDFTDEKRLREIVSKTRSQLETALQSGGNASASRRASAYTSSGSAYSEMISGISFYRFIRDLERSF